MYIHIQGEGDVDAKMLRLECRMVIPFKREACIFAQQTLAPPDWPQRDICFVNMRAHSAAMGCTCCLASALFAGKPEREYTW